MKILFCTGGSEKSENAIRAGSALATKLGAEGTVLSVGPPPDMIYKMFGAEFRKSEVTIDTDRAVAKNTAKYAESGDYDFIVMSAKGKPGDRRLLGSNTRKVLAKAKIPVYIV